MGLQAGRTAISPSSRIPHEFCKWLYGLFFGTTPNESARGRKTKVTVQLGKDRRVFVFDLGGGTFDATVMEVSGSTIRMLQKNGDRRLGGADWDDALTVDVAKRFEAEHGSNPLKDAHASQDLQMSATAAKETLSKRSKTTIVCGYDGKTARVELTRDAFESLTSHLVDRCEGACDVVLSDAGLTWRDVDTVLLVGGSTRMPAVQQMVRRISGKECNLLEVNPDDAVALGAAIHATLRGIEEQPGRRSELARAVTERYGTAAIRVIDGATHSLGVILTKRAVGGKPTEYNHVMIEKMTAVPCEKVNREIGTLVADQLGVRFTVVQGLQDGKEETADIRFDDYSIGELRLELPPGLPAGAPLELTYKYNVDQTLEVSARGPDGRTARTTINRSTLDPEQVTEAAAHLHRLEIE